VLLRRARRDAGLLLLLAVLPALAYFPAWANGHLLGPGDGAMLHYPLRAQAWEALRRGEVPGWNPTIFLGTPLLAAYAPGALYPPMAVLAALPSFLAFQLLVLSSLGASGVLVFLYLRRLGAERVGAFVGGLCFALGPYLVNHLGDTATVVAAPMLVLLLLAAESHVNRGTPSRAAGLAVALALLLLAGSPEAARAGGALLAGRLGVAHVLGRGRGPRPRASLVAVAAGVLLAAPQLLPTLIAAGDAGRVVTGLADVDRPYPGLFGLILRYVSHTPAGALALAALPLALTRTPVRVLGLSLAICLALQWGRGPLAAPGALALVFDLTLAILAGLSLSAQWRARHEPLGARLRAYFLTACLGSSAALSVAAAAVAPLPETLAGAVGVLAVSLILYFSLASSPHRLRAAIWLLPLTVSFLLQPSGRRPWEQVPRRAEIEQGTATRQGLLRAMGGGTGERVLALVREWPAGQEPDLAYGNWLGLAGGRSANGYDPMVPWRTRALLGGMGVGGTLPGAFFRTDPARLEAVGVRWVMVPTSALVARGGGDRIDATLSAGERRFFPVPISPATDVDVVSLLSDAVGVGQDAVVAWMRVRLATGRSFELPVRAGVHTAEWAWDRPDVRRRVAHGRAPVAESWRDPQGFEGHRYRGHVALPGRYVIDAIEIEATGPGRLTVAQVAVHDGAMQTTRPVSLPAAYVSETRRFVESAGTPRARLYEVTGSARAWVAGALRREKDDEAVLKTLGALTEGGVDPRAVALATQADAQGVPHFGRTRGGRADVLRATPEGLDVRAEGPGILVVTEAWDRGWSAEVDGTPAAILRVNHGEIGLALAPGPHRVVLRYRPPGLVPGLVLAAAGVALLVVTGWRRS
jgi:hypothetical protein